MRNFEVQPGGALTGRVQVPGDKSISHRSVLLGALAEGTTEIMGFLEGEDTRATAAAMQAMGIRIDADGVGNMRIEGRGLHGLSAPSNPLDLGNSGTGMRLLTGVLAGQRFASTVVGDESLMTRPMGRIRDPLMQMGADVSTAASGTPPLVLAPAAGLRGIRYDMPVASAQVKSCLLLAGLYADGVTQVIEPGPCRDHTERMLAGFGYAIARDGASVWLEGGGSLKGGTVQVPADISSAAFFIVGASIAPASDLLIENVGVNPTRDGVIHILREMGANIELLNERTASGEPVADIRVRTAELHGIDVPAHLVANAIDEFPAIFVAASCAEGETVLRGAEELRVKETDRIAAMAAGLQTLGAQAEPTPDGMRIVGTSLDGSSSAARALHGGRVRSFGDHRIAMAFAMAALVASDEVTVEDCDNVQTSFPGFAALAAGAGLNIQERDR
jgi:3-phosphoshikimate 1-carboxyvinyltransferase